MCSCSRLLLLLFVSSSFAQIVHALHDGGKEEEGEIWAEENVSETTANMTKVKPHSTFPKDIEEIDITTRQIRSRPYRSLSDDGEQDSRGAAGESRNDDAKKKMRKVVKKVVSRRVKEVDAKFVPDEVDNSGGGGDPGTALQPLTQQEQQKNRTRGRGGRFFSLFTVIHFNNDLCTTGTGVNGTCYASADCIYRGGVVDGSCASGFGVCCRFLYQCGSTTSENGSIFTNPPTPQRICTLIVNRNSNDICQIRLDFDIFDIATVDSNGVCGTDFFLVTGGTAVPQICGMNTGSHVIYSVTSDSGPSQMTMIIDPTVTNATATRTWRIRTTQYECSSRLLAPVGCLQFHYGASGIVSSFNYRPTSDGINPDHLANQNYAICIRVENGYCGVKYAQLASDPYSFTLTDASLPAMAIATLLANVKFGDALCTKDYVIIAGGSQDGTIDGFETKDRYCGTSLGRCFRPTTMGGGACQAIAGPVVTLCEPTPGVTRAREGISRRLLGTLWPVEDGKEGYSTPFTLRFVTDGDETGDMTNNGFRLAYTQLACK